MTTYQLHTIDDDQVEIRDTETGRLHGTALRGTDTTIGRSWEVRRPWQMLTVDGPGSFGSFPSAEAAARHLTGDRLAPVLAPLWTANDGR